MQISCCCTTGSVSPERLWIACLADFLAVGWPAGLVAPPPGLLVSAGWLLLPPRPPASGPAQSVGRPRPRARRPASPLQAGLPSPHPSRPLAAVAGLGRPRSLGLVPGLLSGGACAGGDDGASFWGGGPEGADEAQKGHDL